MKISILQTDIVWENKDANLSHLHQHLMRLSGETDLVVLPEMFTTGFTMNSKSLAEPTDGNTINTLKEWSEKYGMAIAGSYIATDAHTCFNRAFFITPQKNTYFYNKRHLFRMGSEPEYFSPGHSKTIIQYKGCHICLLVCYDLRFPVWSRNVNNQYDLLIYCANWPESRRKVWDTLLKARAIENMSYVCGVNRVGTDGNNLLYNGGSMLISPKGEELCRAADNTEEAISTQLDMNKLHRFREKFPVWKDADKFVITE